VVCENVSPINGRGQFLTEITRRPLADPRREAATWTVTTTNVTHSDPVIVGDEVVTAEQQFNETKKCWEYPLVARDLATGREVRKMRSIAFSPDGALAAAGSDTGKVVVWDVDL